jgi:hypothetical protein
LTKILTRRELDPAAPAEILSRLPGGSENAVLAVFERLAVLEWIRRTHQRTQWTTSVEYDPQPPFDTGSPDKAGPELQKLALKLLADSQV